MLLLQHKNKVVTVRKLHKVPKRKFAFTEIIIIGSRYNGILLHLSQCPHLSESGGRNANVRHTVNDSQMSSLYAHTASRGSIPNPPQANKNKVPTTLSPEKHVVPPARASFTTALISTADKGGGGPPSFAAVQAINPNAARNLQRSITLAGPSDNNL